MSEHPVMSTSKLDELESHLRDSVESLGQSGLKPEESFMIATHRLGKTKQIQNEFAKSDPTQVWRHHLIWMLLGWITCMFAQQLSSTIVGMGTLGLKLGWNASITGWITGSLVIPIWIICLSGLFAIAKNYKITGGQDSLENSLFSKWSFTNFTIIGYAVCFVVPFFIRTWVYRTCTAKEAGEYYSAFLPISIFAPLLLMILCMVILRTSSLKLKE